MNICAIICEFNPFHNGHAYLIERAKQLSGCDAVLCIMSGSFTQRGEMCILDKYVRARHAIYGGADAVIELPALFAVAPAEIFARGAVKILSSLPAVKSLCFGCENALDFEKIAQKLAFEEPDFKDRLYALLDSGESYASAYAKAFGQDGEKLSSPNNILAAEYAKANIREGKRLTLYPVTRLGGGYHDGGLEGQFSSAKAIRENRGDDRALDYAPDYVIDDLRRTEDRTERFKRLAADKLFFADKLQLRNIYGCSEGLENRLKSLSLGQSFDEILRGCTSKRYPTTRIRRILCANLLSLDRRCAEATLKKNIPVKVLAVRKSAADDILPLIDAKGDEDTDIAELAKLTDESYRIWRHINFPFGEHNVNQKMILV